MSEPTPSAIPLSASHGPPRKKPRYLPPSASAAASQANEIDNLMYDPSHPVTLPSTSALAKSAVSAPPEIVSNMQGSSAGAGSGEFHVYKASRRREYERLRQMDEESKREEDEEEWERNEREKREADEERTRRNREKRMKKKGKKGKGGDGKADVEGDGEVKKKKKEKMGLKVPEVRRGSREGTPGSVLGVSVAEVIKENGITIHDDDD